jgi:hypothetical protein
MQLSESMRLFHWFAHSVNLIGRPSLVFCAAKGLLAYHLCYVWAHTNRYAFVVGEFILLPETIAG